MLLLVWQVLAMVVAHRLFPGPLAVAQAMLTMGAEGRLLADLGKTLLRALSAFCIAMVVGTVLGIWLGRQSWADRLFSGWLVVGLNLPAIVVAIVFYIWLGLTEFALIAAVVVNKAPLVIVTIREGVRSFSAEYEELAAVLRLDFRRRLALIYWPQLLPFVLASARTGLSLIWKIVLVFEVLGSDGGVGYRVGVFFQFFDVTAILAYASSFIVVVLGFEYGVLRPLERRAMAWRHTASA